MHDFIAMWDWAAFSLRWLHVVTAMAWIGASFYFIALDLMLKPSPGLPEGASGDEWEVHGGGFYRTVKYSVAPPEMPGHLTWHKWQSYATWLSGVALLMVIYWAGGEIYLLDPARAGLELWQGILISGGSLAIGWLAYDAACKSRLGDNPALLMLLLLAMLVLMSWGYNQVFTGRAALLHLGAFAATIMTANVFFQIMPNQRIVVEDLKAGRAPDAKYGKIAKVRSTHNNYLTLPVVFLMLSNHYPLAFATEFSWIIAGLVFPAGAAIRHYFNTLHKTGAGPRWTWAVAALLMIVIAWLSAASTTRGAREEAGGRELTPHESRFASAEGFEHVVGVVRGNCSACHAREPFHSETMLWPPKGVVLETEADIARNARGIFLQAGASHAMPPPNAAPTMTGEDRASIAAWYRDAARGASRRAP